MVTMNCDEVFQLIGEFGRYQWFIFSVICLSSLIDAMITFLPVFISSKTDHWCSVGHWSGEVVQCQTADIHDYLECIHHRRNASIPREGSGYSQCLKYDTDYPPEWYQGYRAHQFTNATMPCDEGWVYDHSQFESTVITEFDLVCEGEDGAGKVEQVLYFFGQFLSTFIFGIVSDRFGRYKAFYISLLLSFTMGVLTAVAPTYSLFALCRFLQGCSNSIYDLSFVIGMELVGPSRRVWAGTFISMFYPVGYICLAGLAYLINKWRLLLLSITSFCALPFLYVRILPESSRWLISKQRFEEAERNILKAARINRTTGNLPPDFMTDIKEEYYQETLKNAREKEPNILNLFRSKVILKKTLCVIFQGAVTSTVYFGLSLSTSDLGVNNYLAFCISGAVELPAYVMCLVIINSVLGRRGTLFFSQFLCGVTCLGFIFIPEGLWIRIVVGMIGKFSVTIAYTVLGILTIEVFPTPLRSTGISFCGMASSVATSISPLVLLLSGVWKPLPYTVFGVTSVIAAFVALLLPETRGKTLPETLNDAKTKSPKHRDSYQHASVTETEV